MKKLFFLLIMLLFSGFEVLPQSIWFINPVNGGTVSGTYTQTTVALNLNYNWQRSSNPNLITYYIKLFPSPYGTQQSNQGSGIAQWWYLPAGTYTWRLELWEGDGIQGSVKTAEQTITFYIKHTIKVSNNFAAGSINIDGQTKSSGSNAFKITGENLSVGAIDQPYSGVNYIWNTSGTNNSNWKRQPFNSQQQIIPGATSRNYNYTTVSNDNGASIIADMKKILTNVTFQNSFIGAGNGGIIKVNGVQYNSPKIAPPVVELNPVTSQSIYQVINGIAYSFTQWNDGNTTFLRTFYPGSNATYTANYSGKPLASYLNLDCNDVIGQPVILTWNDHPNTNVTQYQIWRKVRHNGVTGNPVLLATKNRGQTTYTDHEYEITAGYTDDLLYYDVRSYYFTENSYADPDWFSVFGELVPKESDSMLTKMSPLDLR